jgi:hypothetical protein
MRRFALGMALGSALTTVLIAGGWVRAQDQSVREMEIVNGGIRTVHTFVNGQMKVDKKDGGYAMGVGHYAGAHFQEQFASDNQPATGRAAPPTLHFGPVTGVYPDQVGIVDTIALWSFARTYLQYPCWGYGYWPYGWGFAGAYPYWGGFGPGAYMVNSGLPRGPQERALAGTGLARRAEVVSARR